MAKFFTYLYSLARLLLAPLILLGVSESLRAVGPEALRQLCPAGAAVRTGEGLVLEGVVVSDWRSENMEFNPNFTAAKLDLHMNRRTAYIQAEDGSAGVRIVFTTPSENRLERWDRVAIDLKGCTLSRTASPDAVTIEGVRARAIMSVSHGTGEGVACKRRSISELKDSDIYTLVTLKDMDVVFKEGSWANVPEEFTPYCPAIHSGVDYSPLCRMDGWARLRRDAEGSSIYMDVNLLCPWRRNGKPLPQGMGDVRGIIVHNDMPRYGGNVGRYSIRPLYEGDIMIPRSGKTPWKTLTGWDKTEETGARLEFELLGNVGNLYKEGKTGDRILSNIGSTTGYFWTDSGSEVRVFSGLGALDAAGRGFVPYSSIMFIGKSASWYIWESDTEYSDTRAFLFSFSTKKVKNSILQFCFEWSEGTQDGNRCWGFPAHWCVECSVDGKSWELLRESATGESSIVLRPIAWRDGKIRGSGHDFIKRPALDSGIGTQQRLFTLPDYACGQKTVYLRLAPASTTMSSVRVSDATPTINGNITRNDTDRETWIRFESARIDYRQQ